MPASIIGPGSISKRPDAFSSSYLVSLTFGPIAEGDNSQGPLARVWKVRIDGDDVWVARQSDSMTAWDAETLLFTQVGLNAIEMDAAFDQNGRVFICVERPTGAAGSSEIWAYFFVPADAIFELVLLGAGRNPRAVLDEYVDTNSSDVLCFYMNDSRNRMCWRQQRDLYAVEYDVAFGSIATLDPELGPVGGLEYIEGGITVDVEGAYTPPTAHPSSTLGDYEIQRDSDLALYQMMLRFSEPVSSVTVAMYYPIKSGSGGTKMALYAVKDIAAFGEGAQSFTSLASVAFPDVHGAVQTLTAPEPFTFVVIKSALRTAPEFSNPKLSPTFGTITFVPARDPTTAIPVPVTSDNRFLEDVYKAIDSRIHILYSERQIQTGHYILQHLESLIYPASPPSDDQIVVNPLLLSGQLEIVVLFIAPIGTDPTQYVGVYISASEDSIQSPNPLLSSGELLQIVFPPIDYDAAQYPDGVNVSANPILVSGILAASIILYDATAFPDGVRASNPVLQSGSLVVYVIVTDQAIYPVGVNATNPILQSGTLA